MPHIYTGSARSLCYQDTPWSQLSAKLSQVACISKRLRMKPHYPVVMVVVAVVRGPWIVDRSWNSASWRMRPDDDLDAALAEREYLPRSIARTGLLALKPLEITSRRDTWHRRLLRR